MPSRRLLLPLLLLAVLALPAVSHASSRQETMFQDDADGQGLVYGSPDQVRADLARLKFLGVERVRVTVSWALVAPAQGATQPPPNFVADDPATYPSASRFDGWARYDTIAQAAAEVGIRLNFNVSAPGPKWARLSVPSFTQSPEEDQRFGSGYDLSPRDYYAFMIAMGRRYAGDYVAPDGQTIPRVSYWSIWNEPNRFTYMAPQWRRSGRTAIPQAAVRYRQMFDAAWAALHATGHGRDTILGGELASTGRSGTARLSYLKPISFVRWLYCLDRSYRPLRGRVARLYRCPASGSRLAFRRAHPGLLRLTGWGHHPYSFILPPAVRPDDPDSAVLADLGRLERTLDRALRAQGSGRRLPLYLTEYGYQTNPPDPYQLWSLRQQASFLNQADWMTVRDPRVRALCQYLLRDAAGDDKGPPGSPQYWGTFQSGLEYANGRRKPSFAAYRLPIWLRKPTVRRGSVLPVWGLVRPARNGARVTVSIEQRRKGQSRFRVVRRLTFASPRGTFSLNLRPSASGFVRYAWRSGGRTFRSRTVAFTVR